MSSLTHPVPLPALRRARASLPAWLRPHKQEPYRFHRLSSEDEGGAGAAGGSAGPGRPAGRWCPEEHAGFLSRLFFSYVDGLVSLGHR